MNDAEHEEIIVKAFPVDYEPWRIKPFDQLTKAELGRAVSDNQAIMWAAQHNYNDESADREDRMYAYESMLRAQHRLADLRRLLDPSRFDVV